MKVLLTVLFAGLVLLSRAQPLPDSLYLAGRDAAQSGKLTTAAGTLEKLLLIRTDEYDGRVLLARVYYWQGKNDSAYQTLMPALERVKTDQEAWLLHFDILLASKNAGKLLKQYDTLDESLKPTSAFRFKRVQALRMLKREDEAYDSLFVLQKEFPAEQQIQKLYGELKAGKLKNSLLLDLEYNIFNVPLSDWKSLAAGYERRTSWGTLQMRLHFANRFDQSASQFETDFYPRINAKTTAYAGFALSNNTLFPGFRAGAEIYRTLPASWELSAGLRYLNFSNNPLTTYTIAATKYLGNYYFSLRPFIIPSGNAVYITSAFAARRYLRGNKHYIGLSAAIGNSPDMDFRLNDPLSEPINAQLYLLDAFALRIDYQRMPGHQLLIRPFVEYRKEEFRPGTYRTRSSFGLSLARNF